MTLTARTAIPLAILPGYKLAPHSLINALHHPG